MGDWATLDEDGLPHFDAPELHEIVPEVEIVGFIELVDVGEYGIALENLCTQIYEHDVTLGPGTRAEIIALGTMLCLDDRYWTGLHEQGTA